MSEKIAEVKEKLLKKIFDKLDGDVYAQDLYTYSLVVNNLSDKEETGKFCNNMLDLMQAKMREFENAQIQENA